jgi:hypothetical protein
MIINLTPHVIDVFNADAPGVIDEGAMIVRPYLSIPPCGTVARIAERVYDDGATVRLPGAGAVAVTQVEYGHVADLPDAKPYTWYVVSMPLALAVRSRIDLLIPWRQVRNARGTVIGCRGLARPM